MKISIVVATYNGGKYILEQLNSFKNQTVCPDEIIISDDGSKDDTVDVINSFINNCPITTKLLYNDNYHGVTGNFENAARYATGDLVFFSDQDDVWYPNKIEETLKAIQKYPDCIGIFSDADCVDSTLHKFNVTFNDSCWDQFKKLDYDSDLTCLLKGEDMLDVAIRGNILGGCCLAIKNKHLQHMFKFCPSIFHDDWLCYCMFVLGDVVALNKPLFSYRLHGNNTVGFSNIVSDNKDFTKIIKKFRRKIKNLPFLFSSNAERAIYFYEFAMKYGKVTNQMDYVMDLNKRRIVAATSSKLSGLRLLKQISKELNQYKTTGYFFECLYLILFSKKKRVKQLSKYIDYFGI